MKKPLTRAEKRKAAIEQIIAVCVQSHERLLALRDLLDMLDATSFGPKGYRCLTPAELARVAEIRAGVG
jgi:hypothetical protein